jgi:hypothetical protein
MTYEAALKRESSASDRLPLGPSMTARKATGPESSAANALRQRVGNQGIQRLMSEMSGNSKGTAPLRSPATQTKLSISEPRDAYEQEADRMANAMMRMPSPGVHEMPPVSSVASPAKVQRLCAECEDELGKMGTPVPRKEQTADIPPVTPSIAANIQGLRGGGNALPAATRAFFEPRFGTDFSDVRVHTGARAEEAAQSIGARAFTVGNDIGFGSGQYSPTPATGKSCWLTS